MFKRIKENEKYQRFKELWADEKAHSIIVLGFWLVFFVGVVLFMRLSAPVGNQVSDNNFSASNFDKMKNYSFSALADGLEVNGFVYDDKMEFILNNHRYFVSDNVYLINGDKAVIQNFDLSFLKINAKMINNLISGLTGTDVDNYTQYIVPLDRFINLYEIDTDVDLSKAMAYNVIVKVYKNDGVIKGVILDLSNYRLFKFNDNRPFVVTIYYYNVNNISDFTKGYEKLVGGI